MPLGTVKSRVRLALVALRRELDRRAAGEAAAMSDRTSARPATRSGTWRRCSSLGALDPDEMAAVREHLADCDDAHAEVLELGEAATRCSDRRARRAAGRRSRHGCWPPPRPTSTPGATRRRPCRSASRAVIASPRAAGRRARCAAPGRRRPAARRRPRHPRRPDRRPSTSRPSGPGGGRVRLAPRRRRRDRRRRARRLERSRCARTCERRRPTGTASSRRSTLAAQPGSVTALIAGRGGVRRRASG